MARGALPVPLRAAADRQKDAQQAGGRASGEGERSQKSVWFTVPSHPPPPPLVTAKSRQVRRVVKATVYKLLPFAEKFTSAVNWEKDRLASRGCYED